MTSETVVTKLMTVRTQCKMSQKEYLFKAYKLKNGVILIMKHEFLGTSTSLQAIEGVKISSIEETDTTVEFEAEEFNALFYDFRERKYYTITTPSLYKELVARMS